MSALRPFILILVLASLDAAAAILLKEAAIQRNPLYAIYGIGLLVAVAALLVVTLQGDNQLTIVSLGWIILFQVVVMLIEYVRSDVVPGRVQLAAIIVALAALAVAAWSPSRPPNLRSEATHRETPAPAATPVPSSLIPTQRQPTLEERLREYMDTTGWSERG